MQLIFYDFEILKQDWFVSFYKEDTNEWFTFRNNRSALLSFILKHKLNYCFVGYNSSAFDDICLKCIWYGLNPYLVVQHCIVEQKEPWTLPALNYKKNIPGFISMDLMNFPTGANAGLKVLEGNLGLDIKEYDLTYQNKLTEEDYLQALEYNKHDVWATYQLYLKLKDLVSAKEWLIEHFGLDKKYLNKTYTVICKNLLKILPQEAISSIVYHKPNCIQIQNDQILNVYDNQTFTSSSVLNKEFNIFGMEITCSLGGIHGAKQNYRLNIDFNSDYVLVYSDVTSLYPNLLSNKTNEEFQLLNAKLENKDSYRNIIDTRIKYKNNHQTKEADALKWVINSVSGATRLYQWQINRKMCLHGQLCIFSLLEQVSTIPSYQCFNLNTDGLIGIIQKSHLDDFKRVCAEWSKNLGLELKINISNKCKIIQKDVNNYIIYDEEHDNLTVKGKDVNKYGELKLNNNTASIIDEAIVKYFVYNKPINETIQEAYDKNEVIKFQIILARKHKNYTETYYGDRVVQKVNRVFPTYDTTKPPLTKMKNGTKCLFADAPEHVIIDNRDVKNIDLKAINLDLNYYFNIINKKIAQWLGKDK